MGNRGLHSWHDGKYMCGPLRHQMRLQSMFGGMKADKRDPNESVFVASAIGVQYSIRARFMHPVKSRDRSDRFILPSNNNIPLDNHRTRREPKIIILIIRCAQIYCNAQTCCHSLVQVSTVLLTWDLLVGQLSYIFEGIKVYSGVAGVHLGQKLVWTENWNIYWRRCKLYPARRCEHPCFQRVEFWKDT